MYHIKKRTLRVLIPLCIIAIVIGIPLSFVRKNIQRDRLNSSFMDAIGRDNYDLALNLLKQGADPLATKADDDYEPGFSDTVHVWLGISYDTEVQQDEQVKFRRRFPLEYLYSYQGPEGTRAAQGSEEDDSAFQQLAVALIKAGCPTRFGVGPGSHLFEKVLLHHHHTVEEFLLRVHPDLFDKNSPAVLQTDAMCTALVIAHQANIDASEASSTTHLAIGPEPASLEAILDKNNRFDFVDATNSTPLLAACKAGLNRAVEVILRHSPRVNFQGKLGVTPLQYAVANCDVNAVMALLQAGADPRKHSAVESSILNAAMTAEAEAHTESDRTTRTAVIDLIRSRGIR